MTDYLQRILRARVYDVARETPLDPAPNLSRRIGNTVLPPTLLMPPEAATE